MNADEYKTLAGPGYAQTRVLGSRFFGSALPVSAVEMAMTLLEEERKRRHDATHWCWAYRIGLNKDITERSSDAGEPHGTAGVPILREIQKADVHGCLVIVTRYFGGTKLGTGGLVRAYGECAAQSLEAAAIQLCKVVAHLRVECPFDDQGTVYGLVHRFQATVTPEPAADRAVILVECAPETQEPLMAALREAGRGRIVVT